MSTFHITIPAHTVIFGPGSIAQLGDAVAQAGWEHILLCTTPHVRSRGHLAAIETALGQRLVATYEGVQPHVPDAQVAEATALAVEHRIDAVIGLGGGSPIGTAKAVSMALQEKHPASADDTRAPVIAIPTTYAGSEMTPVFGVTYHEDGVARKVTRSDARIAPRLIIYDPLLTLDLSPRMTAGTGINAAAHCIEALYSITRNPLSSATAYGGLRAIAHALPRCYASGNDVDTRDEMLSGAFLAGTALAHVAMGLHHGICHVIGGTTGAAHGDANSVMLPHVMRFNLQAVAPQLAEAAAAMGVATLGQSVEAMAEAATRQVADWVTEMRLPARLRDLGIQEHQVPELARMAFASRTVHNNPRPISSVAEIETLLRKAW
ncbi:MAG TPA: iron-containing alcohol dehydrogenase [Ktedonobacterales bacterium]|nr:iron-containing alcohol dehydrogenase [Ktedonobacterales bacterium]